MVNEPVEVSARLVQMILSRVLELQLGADRDEEVIPLLLSHDHQYRQRKLIDAQRVEAERLLGFLSSARVRDPKLPQQV
jgi:hypothetical protein